MLQQSQTTRVHAWPRSVTRCGSRDTYSCQSDNSPPDRMLFTAQPQCVDHQQSTSIVEVVVIVLLLRARARRGGSGACSPRHGAAARRALGGRGQCGVELRERRLHLASEVGGRLERPLPSLPEHALAHAAKVREDGVLKAGGGRGQLRGHGVADRLQPQLGVVLGARLRPLALVISGLIDDGLFGEDLRLDRDENLEEGRARRVPLLGGVARVERAQQR
mmetsp:Transcript_16062/g.41337  ORF Transcript_16062/g.41337 Transcript_16062/m.41337 type:complete len:220 (+) Transcript_16062:262-921(+)